MRIPQKVVPPHVRKGTKTLVGRHGQGHRGLSSTVPAVRDNPHWYNGAYPHKTLWVNYGVPSEGYLEAEVRQIRIHKAGGHTRLRTVRFNKWLREA